MMILHTSKFFMYFLTAFISEAAEQNTKKNF